VLKLTRAAALVGREDAALPYRVAARSEIGCIARTFALLVQKRLHLPSDHVGMLLRFANGTTARVFRETLVERGPTEDPCILVVEFRLRLVRGLGHALFRKESILNTPLFAGFPGLVSKLWLAHDEHGVYRGLYEWDGPSRATHYARCLWRVLAVVCVPGSIHYVVLPGLRRDEVLSAASLDIYPAEGATAWWWPVAPRAS
jgi:hypothetical protein